MSLNLGSDHLKDFLILHILPEFRKLQIHSVSWVSYRRCVTTHGFVSGRSGKKREIGFHWLTYFLDASDASSIQPWPNRTCIVAADSWTDRAIVLIARFLSNIRKSVRVTSGFISGRPDRWRKREHVFWREVRLARASPVNCFRRLAFTFSRVEGYVYV